MVLDHGLCKVSVCAVADGDQCDLYETVYRDSARQIFATFPIPGLTTGCMAAGAVFMRRFLKGTLGDMIAVIVCVIIYMIFLALFARRRIAGSVRRIRDDSLK